MVCKPLATACTSQGLPLDPPCGMAGKPCTWASPLETNINAYRQYCVFQSVPAGQFSKTMVPIPVLVTIEISTSLKTCICAVPVMYVHVGVLHYRHQPWNIIPPTRKQICCLAQPRWPNWSRTCPQLSSKLSGPSMPPANS